MKFFILIVLVLYLSSANSTFWFRNDFERAIDTYKNNLSKDFFPYLRALSIYKRKLQLLGFYPIVLNDDGLEYVSLEPYIIEDDYDDQMYELLKKLKKEKKLRRKLLKEKMKKLKKETLPTTTTIAEPITNIVYSFPLSIATNPKTDEITNNYQQMLVPPISVLQSLDLKNPKQTYDNDSEELEDNSTELDDSGSDIESVVAPKSHHPNEEKESKETQTTGSQNDSILLKKLIVGTSDNENNSESIVQIPGKSVSFTDAEMSGNRITNQTSINSTTITSTTTPYPLLTVFPDPDEKVIEEILDQQEIVNKISHEGEGNETVTETVPTTVDHNEITTLLNFNNSVGDHLQTFGDDLSQKSTTGIEGDKLDDVDLSQTTETKYEAEIEKDFQQHLKQGRSESSEKYESNGLMEVTDNYLESTTDFSENIVELSSSIPPGVLDFFRDTPSELGEHSSSIASSSYFKNLDIISASDSTENPLIPSKITEASETTDSIDGHLEIYSERNDHNLDLNNTVSPTTQPSDEHLTSSKIPPATNEISDTADIISPGIHYELSSESASISKQTEISPQTNTEPLNFAIDPRQLGDIFESSGLTDFPAVTETLDYTNGRRSDVNIEADDVLDEDVTDNLPYNLSAENLLEHSNVIENTSAETSTQQPTSNPFNSDSLDEIDREIIPLIPLIIKQIKLGNVSPEEMKILKNTFGQFWPIVLEEANRELDSSEEMNPVLSEVLSTASRRVVKREATFSRFQRPIIGRRIYYDDVDDYDYRRRYERLLRRRPIIEYYYK